MDPKQKLVIQKLVNQTLSGKYHWERLSGNLNSAMIRQIQNKINIALNIFDSYSSENEKQYVTLISSIDNLHYLFLKNKQEDKSTLFQIEISDFYKLKTIIENQLLNDETILDDFLKF